MLRHLETPRRDWRARVQQAGLVWSETDRGRYWTEEHSYSFTTDEIDRIERATAELHARCLDAVQAVIDRQWWSRFGIAPHVANAIEQAWKAEPPALYGRFDLAYDGHGEPKLLEYNADTPTALLEAAVVQWDWVQDVHPGRDQFNSIHERLIAKWRELTPYLSPPVYFTGLHDEAHEDWLTLAYLQETCAQAGLRTQLIPLEDIGVRAGVFVDTDDRRIGTVFKLYPWDWIVDEPFGAYALDGTTQWIEPIWKMLLSSKAILPVLWSLFPRHRNLLPAMADEPAWSTQYVKKPRWSREGANVTIVDRGHVIASTDGEYQDSGFIYQALAEIPSFAGARPIIGSWVIDGEPAGIGIREADGLITDNRSRFVPHWIE